MLERARREERVLIGKQCIVYIPYEISTIFHNIEHYGINQFIVFPL